MFNNGIKSVSLVFVSVLVLLCTQSVVAQSNEAAKKGFKITKDTVLNVGLSIIPEYESNTTKASENSTSTDNLTGTTENFETISDMVLHYSPNLRIKLDDQSKTVGMSLFFDYNHYLGLEDKSASKKLSDLDIKSELLGEFNKNGFLIFDFKNTFGRTATPDGQEISGKHKNILENFIMGLGFKNIEDTLYGKIQAGVDFNYLEQSKDNKVYRDYNYVSFVGDIFGRWKFLPRTMIFMKAAFRYQDFYESSVRDDSRSMPLNVFAGLMGQMTPHISTKISGGYSANFGKETRHDYNANAELIFKYNNSTFMNVGYLKSMRPSAYFQYYSTHRAYLNFKQKFARVFLAGVDSSYSYISFGKSVEFNGVKYAIDLSNTDNSINVYNSSDDRGAAITSIIPTADRNDHLLLLNPYISYSILSWLGLKLSYEMEYRKTDYYKEIQAVYTDASAPAYNRTVNTHFDYINHRVLFTIALDY
ncbi:MAG TPA: hypothetical protein PLW37_01515 [bacterium]|nr:hypothetical protein [bacterium]